MQLGNLLKSVNKKYQKIPISGISFNSKNNCMNIFLYIYFNKVEVKNSLTNFSASSDEALL